MRFSQPLIGGRLIRRYKRFLVDVRLDDGRVVTAHTNNTGAMIGCATPGVRVWLSHSQNPTRKLPYTWEITTSGRAYVAINTLRANHLVEEAIRGGRVPELAGYASLSREVRLGERRIDLCLDDARRGRCWVEVKNVTLADGRTARFPDAVSARGRAHLETLQAARARGERAVMFYLVARGDCDRFAPAWAIDPDYSETMVRAARAGVELYAYRSRVRRHGVLVTEPLAVSLR
ncbi:MAG: DNA/RNA nuclease SfsA [Myxococcales bacterium]|nr:DNA/RNA nuclease SfsA [Myxococcales bacterium]